VNGIIPAKQIGSRRRGLCFEVLSVVDESLQADVGVGVPVQRYGFAYEPEPPLVLEKMSNFSSGSEHHCVLSRCTKQ
jgi:hypothetical protein